MKTAAIFFLVLSAVPALAHPITGLEFEERDEYVPFFNRSSRC